MRPPTLAPPTSAGRRVRHRLASAGRCRLRPGQVSGQVDTESEELSRRSSPCAIRRSPARSAAGRRRPTTPARASAVSTSIACLSNRTSSESLSQKQPQAAQPAHTCGNRLASVSLRPACRPAVGPTAIPGRAAAVEDSRTERVMASYRRLPSLAVNPDKSSRFAASTDDPDFHHKTVNAASAPARPNSSAL
jgi:hypothetical protein